jgi:hypothetical protein
MPTEQRMHVNDAIDEYIPALHPRHAIEEAAPVTVDALPAGHEAHVAELDAPTAVEYVPAPHGVQLVVPVTRA